MPRHTRDLLDAAVAGRAHWTAKLSPDAFAQYDSARDIFTQYALRCSKKLNVDVNAAMKGVLANVPSKRLQSPLGPLAPTVNVADLRITKFVEPFTPIQAGQIFTYTIFVDNLGPDIADNVIITDTLLSSTNVSVQSCAFSVSQGGGSITQFTCTTGPLVSTQFGTDVGTFSTNHLDPPQLARPAAGKFSAGGKRCG